MVTGTVDQPAAPYRGQPLPDWVVRAAQSGVRQDPGSSLSYAWRCMGGRVLACADASGAVSCGKPSQDTEPSEEIGSFCSKNKNKPVPVEVAGNTISSWTCRKGMPTHNGYRSGLDAQGYFASLWRDVSDFAPARRVGDVPRVFVGKWRGEFKGGGLFKTQYVILSTITGGKFGQKIGKNDYFQTNTFDGSPSLLCSTELVLRADGGAVSEIQESFIFRTAMISACPVQERLFLQHRDGQLWMEWRRANAAKPALSGYLQRQ